MTPTQLLSLADDVVLVARPRGVVHAYRGPLTPSGRSAPRAAQPVCHTRTRRLCVVEPGAARVCARCTARLAALPRAAGRVGTCLSRDDYARAYAGLDPFRLYVAAETARTPAQLERVAHLSLVTVGFVGCKAPVVTPDGQELSDLNSHIGRHRHRVHGNPVNPLDETWNLVAVNAASRRKADRQLVRHDREERVRQIGIRNVKPTPNRKGAPTP